MLLATRAPHAAILGAMRDCDRTNVIDLWFLRTAEVNDPCLLRACDAIMEPAERDHQEKRISEKLRHEHRVTRALCRAVLGRELGVTPGSLRFARNSYGRPNLNPPSSLRFNLTHTVDFVALIIARNRELGVDAEPTSRAAAILGLGRSAFTAQELDFLAGIPFDERGKWAVCLWTIKEAYIKARGMGLSLPIQKIEIAIDVVAGSATLRLLEPIDEAPSRWKLGLLAVGDHIVATCVEQNGEPDFSIELHHANLAELLADWDPES